MLANSRIYFYQNSFTKYFLLILLYFILFVAFKTQAQTPDVQTDLTYTQTLTANAVEFSTLSKNFPYQNYFKADEQLAWQITLPKQVAAESPLGVLVYLSPTPSGTIPEVWKPLLIEKQLIWISADKAGNQVNSQRRVIQALYAVRLAMKTHKVNSQRVYISGFSGGGRVATMMAPLYPYIFSGGIFMGGANEFNFTKSEHNQLQKNRYTFINGEKDFNLAESKKVFRKLKQQGIDQVEFFEVPNLEHHFPPAQSLAAAIDFLDKKEVPTLSTPH